MYTFVTLELTYAGYTVAGLLCHATHFCANVRHPVVRPARSEIPRRNSANRELVVFTIIAKGVNNDE